MSFSRNSRERRSDGRPQQSGPNQANIINGRTCDTSVDRFGGSPRRLPLCTHCVYLYILDISLHVFEGGFLPHWLSVVRAGFEIRYNSPSRLGVNEARYHHQASRGSKVTGRRSLRWYLNRNSNSSSRCFGHAREPAGRRGARHGATRPPEDAAGSRLLKASCRNAGALPARGVCVTKHSSSTRSDRSVCHIRAKNVSYTTSAAVSLYVRATALAFNTLCAPLLPLYILYRFSRPGQI